MDCVVETLRHKLEMMRLVLDERGRRLWAGVEASAIGRGGIGNHQNLRGHVTDRPCFRPARFIRNCRNRPGFRYVYVN